MVRIVSHPLGVMPAIAPRDAAWSPGLEAALIAAADAAATTQRLRTPGALVVTSGQQPGLFTGPLYTIHKALSAAALAQVLERRWHRPVVPVFWIAGDDHDFAEASTTAWLDQSGDVVRWSLPAREPSAPQLAMADTPLPAQIGAGLELLESSLPAGPARERTMAWLHRHYVAGATMHHASAGALAELLAPFGVVCFDPTHSAAKSAQVPLLRQAIVRAGELDAALAALPDTASGVRAGDGATLVFITTSSGRERLMIDGDGFRTRRSGRRFSSREVLVLLDTEPERFSANVLLRPVVEAAILPTVAYVAGPGELRYLHGQCAALYPHFEVTPPVPVPRWSGTVVPHWAERLLDRLQVTAAAVIEHGVLTGHEVLDRDFPADARQALDALRAQVDRSREVLLAAGRRIDPVLDAALVNRMRRLDELADDLDDVLHRHLRKRSDIAYAQFERLRQALRPGDQPQERVLTAATFYGRYGESWLDAVFESVTAWAAERGHNEAAG